MNVSHKRDYEKDYRNAAEVLATRYNYPHVRFMDRTQRRPSDLVPAATTYGVRDMGTGHIHPLKLLAGLARVAAQAVPEIYEMTPAKAIRQQGGRTLIDTPRGTITAERALIATNAYIGNLEPQTAAHVMPIRSFIGATEPRRISHIFAQFRSGGRLSLCRALFPKKPRQQAAVWRTRSLYRRQSARYFDAYPSADHGNLSGPERHPYHPRLGWLCRNYHAAQAFPCAMSCPALLRSADFPAMA